MDGATRGRTPLTEPRYIHSRVMAKHRIYTMSVASVYPHYVTKVTK